MAAQQARNLPSARALKLDVTGVIPWGLVITFVAGVAGLLAAGSGRLVELLFAAAALAVGAALYLHRPTLYLGFTWWLFFLTPEVRRLIDYQTGWNPISPVMLTPYLVAGLAAFTVIRCVPQLLQRPRLFPFMLILVGLNYGYTIGLVRAGPFPATYGLLTWIVPLLFGFHMAARSQLYPLYRDAMRRVFLWGVLAMGVYGVVQFYVVPPWDAYWMGVAPMASIGQPEPFQVRVWSTMNSPGPFAITMMAGLLLLFVAGGPLRSLAGALGYAAFLLSLVRSAWLGWAIGVAFLLLRIRAGQKLRLMAAAFALVLLSLPLLQLEPVAEVITARFESMQQLEEDESYQDRLALYRDFILASATNVIGEGIGSTSVATKLANEGELGALGNFDSGVLEIMFVLGWPGTVLVIGGTCWLLSIAFAGVIAPRDLALQAARAIVLATFAQMVFINTLVGVQGMVFWTFLGLTLSARTFYSEQNWRAGEAEIALYRRKTDYAPPDGQQC